MKKERQICKKEFEIPVKRNTNKKLQRRTKNIAKEKFVKFAKKKEVKEILNNGIF